MEKEFNWVLPADPDPKSDNYYNGIVSKELKDSSNIAETLRGFIRRESVEWDTLRGSSLPSARNAEYQQEP